MDQHALLNLTLTITPTLRSDQKLEALYAHIRTVQHTIAYRESPIEINVDRRHLVPSVLDAFRQISDRDLLRAIDVSFVEEEALFGLFLVTVFPLFTGEFCGGGGD